MQYVQERKYTLSSLKHRTGILQVIRVFISLGTVIVTKTIMVDICHCSVVYIQLIYKLSYHVQSNIRYRLINHEP